MPGHRTSLFGQELATLLAEKRPDLRVFYDHGDASNPNVGKIYAHVGKGPSRATNLAEVDVMVVNEDNEILLLIEIEEEASLGPKKILGVLMAILLAESFSFSGQTFTASLDTIFINSGSSKPTGSNAAKIREEIAPRVEALAKEKFVISRLEFVLEDDAEQVVSKTMELCKQLLFD